MSLEKVGNVLVSQGKFEEGLALFQQPRQNTGWQRDLIVSYYKLGTLMDTIGSKDNNTHAQGFLQTAQSMADNARILLMNKHSNIQPQ